MKTYERVLPEGYDKVKIINSQDRRDNIIEMICIFSPSLLILIFGILFVKVTIVQWLTLLLLIPLIPAYIILHELVHGITYLILTGQKFKIGRDGNGDFYCILPRIYVYYKTQLLCAAAPLTFFTITLLSGTVIAVINGSCVFIVLSGLMAFHFFACRSDMYLIKELFKIRDPHLLIGEDEDGNNIVFKA